MKDIELAAYNERGLIPGPNENLEDFEKRVNFCLQLKADYINEVTIPDSFEINDEIIDSVLQLTEKNYGTRPDWVPIFFSNWRLAPWHGGAAWIFKLHEDSPLSAVLQLRKPFYYKKCYLGIYERDELMAHEMAHVGRMAFEEKKFEELLAYRTSKKGFLRYFGPIIQSAFESRLVVYLLATLLIMDVYFLFQGSLSAYLDTQSFKLLPLLLVLYGLFRLRKRQATLAKAEKNLHKSTEHAKEIVYRLTDNEIELFARSTKKEIESYIAKEPSLRWHMIRYSYLYKI